MFDRYESERFGNYISELRKKRNVSMEQLSDGLCSVSMLGRFEKGDRLPGKRLRDRLLSRLGETNTVYENFLDGDEYTLWKLRQQILDSIVDWRYEKANNLLREYAEQCDMEKPLEKQFVLTMKAQLCRRDGADRETLGELFKEALKLSVPKIDNRSIVGMCLSIQEVDLVLEYTRYKVEDIVCRQERYEEILAYIAEVFEDEVSQAKTYPKAFSIYAEICWREQNCHMKKFSIFYGYAIRRLRTLEMLAVHTICGNCCKYEKMFCRFYLMSL